VVRGERSRRHCEGVVPEAIQKATVIGHFWIASFLAMTGAGAPDANLIDASLSQLLSRTFNETSVAICPHAKSTPEPNDPEVSIDAYANRDTFPYIFKKRYFTS